MPQVLCIMAHEWGNKIKVGSEILTIPEDGSPMDVSDEQAAKLLQNRSKYRSPDDLAPDQDNSAPQIGKSAAILTEKSTGRVLSVAEVDDILAPTPAPAEKPKEAEIVSEALTEDDDPGEPAPGDEWPEVSMQMSKAELRSVANELSAAGYDISTDGTKADILEAIESVYDAINDEG